MANRRAEPWYLPSRDTVWERAAVQRLMTQAAWPEEFMDSVMSYDHPTPALVMWLIERYGQKEALRRLLRFIQA